jgi:uncharacterized protein (TIGR04222 family)
MNLNPLDLPGPAFLAFYSFALIAAHLVGKALIRLCQSKHIDEHAIPDRLQPSEVAYLAGGTERAVDTALVRLLKNDLIAVKQGGGAFEVKGTKPPNVHLSELQADVYREISRRNDRIEVLHRMKSAFISRIQVHLANAGLLLGGGSVEASCIRAAKTLPFAAVIALGIIKIFVGIARHRPVTFLVVFVLVSLVILGVKFFKLPLRSARGEALLKRLTGRNAALETAVRRKRELDDGSLLLAVALFGPQVLSASELAWMHEGFVNRQLSSSDSGGGGGGSCSGGCGGGGCGGCGG